uniref:B1496_F1_2 n=1 Tax=Mycobacterium leprae TaxID=1769 RepID=Q49696_MYCLR|nr:B1496_F1_2 [Mycobacterium leprae]
MLVSDENVLTDHAQLIYTPLVVALADPEVTGNPQGRKKVDTFSFQTVKPRARSCSRPSSLILSGPHGGFQTQLIRRSLTRPLPTNALRDCSSITSFSGQAADVNVMSTKAIIPSLPSSRPKP